MNLVEFLSHNFYLVILAAAPFLIAGQVYYLVRKMSEPEKMYLGASGGLAVDKQQYSPALPALAERERAASHHQF